MSLFESKKLFIAWICSVSMSGVVGAAEKQRIEKETDHILF